MAISSKLEKFISSSIVENFILIIIIFNSALLGLMTDVLVMSRYGTVLTFLNNVCTVIFIVEVFLKLIAFRLAFFKEAWNIFDFFIILLAILPTTGSYANFRMFRTFRVLRSLRSLRLITKLGNYD